MWGIGDRVLGDEGAIAVLLLGNRRSGFVGVAERSLFDFGI